ncbi:phosphate ABC transporter substrate-binding protein [Thalassotalea sp. G2M2-11]|uniref:phosphate ABC transporter substrate-binding protein n=1 Tax=Thalassotalea sp. G2M2-11 TaxID=2787627 RepID=UPI0019D01BCF|nr:phosphate ABC transporter substrate-binding protein [Thalassotalea sp. G2M2-11]
MKIFVSVLVAMCSIIAFNVNAVNVIVHPSNTNSLDKSAIKKIFLGKSKKFPNGEQAIPVALAGGDARTEFLGAVIGKSESQLKAYWSKLIFTGKGQAPKSVDTEAELVKLISQNPNLIGYVSDAALDDSVKVLVKL